MSYCHRAPFVVRPSVRLSSVRRPSVNFHIFDFSFKTAKWNSTKLDRKQDLNTFYQVCVFRADRKKQDDRPGLWLAEIFSDFSSETAGRNSTKLDRKQDLNTFYQVCVFRVDNHRKNKMAALASDWLRYFRLLLWNRWTEFNETWQEARSQRPLPSLCFWGWSEKKNKMAALASDWLRHFRLLLWNRWMEFNETWQEARSQSPLPSLCFSGRSEKQGWPPWPLIGETFATFPLKPLNRIRRNLIGSKISTPSTKFVFFGPIGKTKWPPWPLIGWDIFWLFLWNHWTEFSKTWQEARS